MVPDGPHRAAVRERLVHSEVEPRVGRFEPRAVERTASFRDRGAAAGGAAEGRAVDALLEEQQLHARVGRCLERLLPARRGAAVAARFFTPALDRLRLALRLRFFEDRLDGREQLGRACVRLRRCPADERRSRLGGECIQELGPHVFRADEDDLGSVQLPPGAVELLGHALQMFVDELLDMPLIPRLRPAALVVLARRLVVVLGDLFQPSAAQPVELTLLATDDGHDRPVSPSDQRRERRKEEVTSDLRAVVDRRRQGERPPRVVEPGREHGEPLRAVSLEIVVEPLRDPLEVGLEAHALLVGQVGPVGPVGRVEHGVHAGLRVARGRDIGRVEVQVEADRAALLGPKARELPEERPSHRSSHTPPLPTIDASILSIGSASGPSGQGRFSRPRSFNTDKEGITMEDHD